jgi:hypothetical protein
MLPDPKQFPNAHVRVQDEPCARLLCEVQFFVEGRSPSGRLIRHITPLSTTYFADDQPTEFLVGTGWFARIEKRGVGEEFVGSYLHQVHLYHCLESNDYGRLLSGNNAYIKVKQLVCRLPIVSVNFEAKRNFCAAQVGSLCAIKQRGNT